MIPRFGLLSGFLSGLLSSVPSGALAATLSGTVTSAEGEPVAGASVVAYDARLNYAGATSTSSGAFAIVGVPEGRYRLRVTPRDEDPRVDRFFPDTWDFCAGEILNVAAAEAITGLEFTLPTGGTLSGRILASDGAPLVGAEVLALGGSERTALVARLGETDDDGQFTVVGLDSEPGVAEPYTVYLAPDGWPRQYLGGTYDDDEATVLEVTLGEGTAAGEHILLDGISVSGTIYGPDGPVAGGTVYAYASSQVLNVPIAADGTWTADGLPPGEVVPWASSDGLATTYYPASDRPGDRIPVLNEGQMYTGADLTLPAESTLTVHLLATGDLTEAIVLLYNDTYTVGRGASLDETGSVTIDALYPGTYYLFVYGADLGYVDDYLRDDVGVPVPVIVDGATGLDVQVPLGASFSGTVRDDAGHGVYGAYVYATTEDGEDTEVAVTGTDGTYTLGGLRGGAFTLKASYAYYCRTDQGWVTTWWPDALEAEDARLTTLLGGEARADVDVTLAMDDDHDAMGDSWERENGLDTGRDDAQEDADGDGYTNVEEWLLGSDPRTPVAESGCGGCGGGGSALFGILPLALGGRLRRRRAGPSSGAPSGAA